MDEKNHSVNNFISEKMTPGGLFSNYLVLSAVFSQQLRKQPLFSFSASFGIEGLKEKVKKM